MFKLIKLALYALIGCALYEFMRGLMQGEGALQASGRGQGEVGGRERNRAQQGGAGRTANITGSARGRTVTTVEATGESVPHRVGRGVVQR